jgi:hypothetical protein
MARDCAAEEAAKHTADTLEMYRGYAATVISAAAATLAEVSDAARALQAAEDSARAHEEGDAVGAGDVGRFATLDDNGGDD